MYSEPAYARPDVNMLPAPGKSLCCELDREKLLSRAFERYYGHLLSAVKSRVRNDFDAEDICQEIFIVLSKKITEVRYVRGWLMNSLMYYIPAYYRASGRLNHASCQVMENVHDLEIRVEQEDYDIRMIVDDMLSSMDNYEDDEELLVFELVALCEYSYVKASRYLGISSRSVNYYYHKVLKRMAAYLRDRGVTCLTDLL